MAKQHLWDFSSLSHCIMEVAEPACEITGKLASAGAEGDPSTSAAAAAALLPVRLKGSWVQWEGSSGEKAMSRPEATEATEANDSVNPSWAFFGTLMADTIEEAEVRKDDNDAGGISVKAPRP